MLKYFSLSKTCLLAAVVLLAAYGLSSEAHAQQLEQAAWQTLMFVTEEIPHQ